MHTPQLKQDKGIIKEQLLPQYLAEEIIEQLFLLWLPWSFTHTCADTGTDTHTLPCPREICVHICVHFHIISLF